VIPLQISQEVELAFRHLADSCHYSVAIYDIAKTRGGTRLKFTQIGIPPNRYSGHYRGWIEAYWTPMKEVFAKGAVSSATRAKHVVDRKERIAKGRFRRKLAKGA
jgi:hypothetical protein